jgi:hypothetical protein
LQKISGRMRNPAALQEYKFNPRLARGHTRLGILMIFFWMAY